MTPSPQRRPTVRLVVATVTSVLAMVALSPAASAAPGQRTKANNDSAVVLSGATVSVRVLKNDTTAGAKSKATVTVVKKSSRLKVTVTKSGRIKVTPKRTTAPGRYDITYRVTSKGQSSKARLRIRVKAKPTPPPVPPTAPPSTEPTVDPTPEPTPTPGPEVSPSPEPSPEPTPGPTPSAPSPEGEPLASVLDELAVEPEVTSGYDRDLWKHWNKGANPDDGCDTRSEVLILEAVIAVAPGTKCAITQANSGGGSWYSYYDGVTGTNPSAFHIDHMVPLAEAHHSGGWDWDAATREAYANDLGDPRSLLAVSASSNRSKSDRDPAEWMPALERCRYASEWIAVKARWQLSVDEAEKATLSTIATEECPTTTVVVIAR